MEGPTIKAVCDDGELQVQEVPQPAPTGQECLIRLLKAGICNTDLEITRGYRGFQVVLGHEFVWGGVETASNQLWIEKRVVGEINVSCSQCKMRYDRESRSCQRSCLFQDGWQKKRLNRSAT